MELKEWMKENRWTNAAFARSLNCTRTHISQIANKRTCAGKFLSQMIEHLTDGQVKKEDLMARITQKENI